MSNLSRAEASERQELIDVISMQIELDVRDEASFTSRTTIDFKAAAGATTFLDWAPKHFVRAELNGQNIESTKCLDDRLWLDRLESTNHLVVEGIMSYGSDGEGLHQHVDPLDGLRYLYAMSFLDAGPRWFACFDQPDLKTPFVIDILVPDGWIVRGTGTAVQAEPDRWRIDQNAPLSTYLISLVAGPWASVEDVHDGIKLSLLARASLAHELASQAENVFAVTKACFDTYHQLFALRYPFGDYHQAFVPDFNAGAMENPGLIVLRDQLLFRGNPSYLEVAGRAGIIAHEMAHQWFGDLVTMRWWDDLWLNESFAEYLGHRTASSVTKHNLWIDFGANRKEWGVVADQGPTTHSIAFNGVNNTSEALANFDGISYTKGACVLRQLAATLGDEVFFGGLNGYFKAHQYANAELADLISAWENAGAPDLQAWVSEWLGKPGMDELRPVRTESGWALRRTCPANSPAERVHSVRCVELDADAKVSASEEVSVTGEFTSLSLPGVGLIVPDALDLSWARVRCSREVDWPLISDVENPATRVVLLNSLRDGVRNGDCATQMAFERVLDWLVGEQDDALAKGLLGFAEQLCGVWSPIAKRSTRRALLAEVCRRLLAEAKPSSERELILVRSLINVTEDARLIEGWLAQGSIPQHRELGADLRWLIVSRLMVLGGDPKLIDAELVRDQSAAGRDAAAGARAAIGTLAAKQDALRAIVEPNDLRAYELYEIAQRLFLPDQYELMKDFVQPYFAALPKLANFRQGWALRLIIARSFPAAMVDAQTLAAARTLIERPDLDATLARALLEPVHGLSQAVRAVGCDQKQT